MVIKCPLTIGPEEEAGLGDPVLGLQDVQGPLGAPDHGVLLDLSDVQDHGEPHGEPHGVPHGVFHVQDQGVVLITWYTCRALPSLTKSTWSKWETKLFTLAQEGCQTTRSTKTPNAANGMLPDTRHEKTGPSLA